MKRKMKFFLKKIKGKCIIFNIEFSLFNISALFNDNMAEVRDNLVTCGTNNSSLSIFAQDSFSFLKPFDCLEDARLTHHIDVDQVPAMLIQILLELTTSILEA